MRKSNPRSSRRKLKHRNQKNLPYLLVFGGVIIIIVGILFGLDSGNQASQAKIDYQPEDIVSDAPFTAIHEMTPPTVSNINFLPKDGPQPEIALSEAFFDFGSIGPSEMVRHDFIIANQGDAPLTIHRAYTTCGCTTAEFSSSVIPPGKVVVMTLVLDAGFHDVSGQTVRRGVIVETNDPNHSQIEIWSQAKVRSNP
jgi:hypothetical protein